MDARERDLEIVRQTAELLASGSPFSEIFEQLCILLARFIDASVVFVAMVQDDGAFMEFAYDHGVSWRDAHVPILPGSQTAKVLQTARPVHIGSLDDLPEGRVPLHVPGAHAEDSASAIFVPLRVGHETVGVLSVQTNRPNAYDGNDLALLETCALYLSIAVQAEGIRREARALVSEHSIDAVTAVAGRRAFDERLRRDWQRARRDGSPLSLLLLDIDWFKRFNDTYGHVAGDACLRQVAQAGRAVLPRESDLFARYGGEEFAAILWATNTDGAYTAAERIRQAVLELGIAHVESPLGCVSVSVGVSTSVPSTALPDSLVRAADRALYAAKTAGRNRVVLDQFNASALHGGEARASAHNLPSFTTSFLGRTEEVHAVAHALLGARLVTVAGTGGVGKTRVAVAAAQRRLYAYADGVWFADLRAVESPEYLVRAVAAAVGVHEQGHRPLRETLLDALRTRKLLLILDNCEHLRDAVAELCEAIALAAPDVVLLTTSREPLHLPFERVLALRPLDEETALALFSERAQAAGAVATSQEEREVLAAICARLDRLPLAIELAAPRLKAMSLERLHESLDRRFEVLGSLRAVVEWSYDLLDARARRVLENASIFSAPAEPQAIRDVCADDEIEPWDLHEPLGELIEKNLVSIVGEPGGERYALLESTREFALARLQARGEEEAVARRHVRYYRALARRVQKQLLSERSEQGITLALAEWDNLRAALDRALRGGLDPRAGRQIARALCAFWTETGRLTDGTQWCELALADPTIAPEERASVLYAGALVAHACGDFERLDQLASELVAIHERGNDQQALGQALVALGNARFKSGDAPGAEALYVRALAAHRVALDRRGIAVSLMNLGSLAADWKLEYARARKLFEESLAIFRSLGISVNAGIVLANLGEIAGYESRFDEAIAFANESLSTFERLHNQTLAAWQLVDLARYRTGLKDFAEAGRLLRQARRYLAEQPALEHVANYFETALVFACDANAPDLAARLAGYLECYRDRHHQPRNASLRISYGERLERLGRALGASELERCVREGADANATALQDEVDALGLHCAALASAEASEHTTP